MKEYLDNKYVRKFKQTKFYKTHKANLTKKNEITRIEQIANLLILALAVHFSDVNLVIIFGSFFMYYCISYIFYLKNSEEDVISGPSNIYHPEGFSNK